MTGPLWNDAHLGTPECPEPAAFQQHAQAAMTAKNVSTGRADELQRALNASSYVGPLVDLCVAGEIFEAHSREDLREKDEDWNENKNEGWATSFIFRFSSCHSSQRRFYCAWRSKHPISLSAAFLFPDSVPLTTLLARSYCYSPFASVA